MLEYSNAMDRYSANPYVKPAYFNSDNVRDNYGLASGEVAVSSSDSIGINMIGKSLIAGRGQGSFRDVLKGAIKQGVASVEMALQSEGGEPGVAAESYGKVARRELREVALANGVEINSIHAPVQVGNLAGRTQNEFNEQARSESLNEIKKAVDFAADVGMGGSVVVHTGEFDRSIKDYYGKRSDVQFEGFKNEENEGFISWVDAKTGQIQRIPRTQKYAYVLRDEDGRVQIVNNNGNIPEAKLERYSYNDLKNMYEKDREGFIRKFNNFDKAFKLKDASVLNAGDGPDAPIKALFGLYLSQQLADAQSRKAMYIDHLNQAKKVYKKIDEVLKFYEKLPPEERKKRSVIESFGANDLIPPDVVDPLEYLKKKKKDAEYSMVAYEEYSVSGTLAEQELFEKARHFKTQEQYALKKSVDSLAELGVYAMQRSEDPEFKKVAKRDIYIAPENIFPEMGYGSHPEELVNLIKTARNRMVDLLTKEKVELNGEVVKNPYYRGLSKEAAEKEAEQHIKATFDFQHLGMWRKHMLPKIKSDGRPETPEEMENRFKDWYLKQVDYLQKSGVLGNLHVVDGMGSGHTHLPAGEGKNPIKEALLKLVKAGYSGVMNSEGYEYNTLFSPNEQVFRTWFNMGSPIYALDVPRGRGQSWNNVQNGYFGYTNIPPYSFGSYVPSNDWTLWSQVPLE